MPAPDQFERLEKLLSTPSLPDLGPNRRPEAKPVSQLDHALAEIFRGTDLSDDAKGVIRAAIYLWHDHLGESHRLAQEIHTRDGGFVHGLMHRREPDYSNAAYWFRRVGEHDCFAGLHAAASKFLAGRDEMLLTRLIPNGGWDPFAFIRLCEEAETSPKWRTILRELQKFEMEALLRTVWRRQTSK